ncbi:hypothetical protein MJI37_30500, partial [Salmonella enterica subsp. enterica serovar Cerro]|nr:hypothetical protein [Salmonella enterica subsp. enterica serovar Cerro]
SERFIASTFQARSQILLPDANGKLLPLTHQQGMTPWDDAIARLKKWSISLLARQRGISSLLLSRRFRFGSSDCRSKLPQLPRPNAQDYT